MVGNHFIHVPSTLDVTALCLHTLVPHYCSITLFNPLTIQLKLHIIHHSLLKIKKKAETILYTYVKH